MITVLTTLLENQEIFASFEFQEEHSNLEHKYIEINEVRAVLPAKILIPYPTFCPLYYTYTFNVLS